MTQEAPRYRSNLPAQKNSDRVSADIMRSDDVIFEPGELEDLLDPDEAGMVLPESADEPDAHDGIGYYLREAGKHKILTFREEKALGKRIEKGKNAQEQFVHARGSATRKKYQALVADGREAERTLVEHNLRWVITIAKRYMGRGLDFKDLIQVGNMGLMRAAYKYEWRRGRFTTYATHWIRQGITRSFDNDSRTIRIPAHADNLLGLLRSARNRLTQELGRNPTIEELAHACHTTRKKAQYLLAMGAVPKSLDAPPGEGAESPLGELLVDADAPDPQEQAIQTNLREKIEDAFTLLTPKEIKVLRLRFGLQDGVAYKLEEVGQMFGVTREWIRQIERSALRKLRKNPTHRRNLRGYLREP